LEIKNEMDLEKYITDLFDFTKKYLITLWMALFRPDRLFRDVEDQFTDRYLTPKVFFFISFLSLIWEHYSYAHSRIAEASDILNAINEQVEDTTYFKKLIYFIPLFIVTYLVLALIAKLAKLLPSSRVAFESLLYYALGAYLIWYLILYLGGLEIIQNVFHATADYRSSDVKNFSDVAFYSKRFNYVLLIGLAMYILLILGIIINRNYRNIIVLLKLAIIPVCLTFGLYFIQEIIDLERSIFKIDEDEVLVKGANGGSSSHGLLECQPVGDKVQFTLSLALINKTKSACYLDARSSLTMEILPDSFFTSYIRNPDLFDTVKFDRTSGSCIIFTVDPQLFKDSGIIVVRPGDIRFVRFSLILSHVEAKRIFSFKHYDPLFIYLPVDIPLNTERKFGIDHARGVIPVFTCN
jgi:hypothetical protein